MYKHILLSAISLLAVATALGIQAQSFAGPREPMAFNAMDLDGDGYVSSREFSQHRDARMPARPFTSGFFCITSHLRLLR